jgi:protein-disulfide isomerase
VAAQPDPTRRRAALVRLAILVALAGIAVAIAVGLSAGSGPSSTSQRGPTARKAPSLAGIPQAGVTLGRPRAKMTLIEFADLQCPFCGQYSTDVMGTVVDRYVRSGRLRYELRLRSFLGADSLRAAGAAAAAAKENRLFQFADAFYARQRAENSGYVTDGFLRTVAKAAGADPAAVVAGAASARRQPLVLAAERLATSLGSTSTPAFYLRVPGGRLVPVEPSALTPAGFTAALDQALAAA